MPERNGKTTIVDVARAAGTSVSSASVALGGQPGVSEKTRAHIVETAKRLGYQPDQRASRLRRRRSRLLGVTFAAHQHFHAEVIENLYRSAEHRGYDLLLSATTQSRSARKAVESLLSDRCETLVLISPDIDESELEQLAERASVVTIGSHLRVPGVDSLHADDNQGVADVVDHLVGLGHSDIAYVDGGGTGEAAARREAYVASMRARGLDRHVRVLDGNPTEESGAEAATRLLESRKALPSAVFAHNDMIAFGLLLTLRSRGVAVPDEVSVVGYDNTRLAALTTVQMTTVSQDAAQLATAAVDRAIERTDNAPPAREIVSPARLVLRATTGPPRPLRDR
ncbi:LacI family DNA-binding transcriptional regulator [Saccharopolyspora mangrovi]|uniref:LacI family DNA-binding transcriptional regulator n=1 Tax=Saccharopolyspora mangrovi TaxID=3082379 RepID=A0ABU6A4K2_9PSEU|nr:LacI family DNA-binding transcriptional regulator [Saccharopolyspora sp. S2-29]MEB3366504.1 LacI family DNA-binding transcriptional regulator [Saccharopolyspora sp. S2-29]